MLFKRIATLIHHLFPPLLLLLGLSIFIQSFFLSRTPFVQRSSCAVGSAGVLLHNALGLNDDEIVYLRKVNLLSDDNNYNNSNSSRNINRQRIKDITAIMANELTDQFELNFTDTIVVAPVLYGGCAIDGNIVAILSMRVWT